MVLPRNQLVEIVTDDLRYLQKEWTDTIDDNALRRGSTVLRQLLVQNELQRAWKAAAFEKEPQIKASSLTTTLNRFTKETIIFAAAGGARYRGAELRGALMLNYAVDQSQIAAMYPEGVPQETIGLRAFIEAPCIVVSGKAIARRVLIKFVANKLGGAHFDTSRKSTPEEQLFHHLDQAVEQFKLLDKNSVYFELLSAGQALAGADDISRFLQRT